MPASNLLTHSRLATSRRCKREHHIKYELGYRPVSDAEELFFGALIHLALEAWWLAVKDGLPSAEWLARAMAALDGARCDPFDLAKARAMMLGYDARWSDEAQHYEVLAVEVRFEADLINPETGHASKTWRLGGKIDVVVRDRRDRKVKLVEHKTSSEDVSLGSTYWRRLLMDGQVSIYFDGGKSLGFDVEECVYDVLAKPQQRPSSTVPVLDEHGEKIVVNEKTGERVRSQRGGWRQSADKVQGYVLQVRDETPDEYFERVGTTIAENVNAFYARAPVVRLEQELQDARFDIWAQARELRENELAKRAQRNPEACRRNGNALCPFFDVCTGQASLDDPSRFRRVTELHPELAASAAEPAPAGTTSSDSGQPTREVG